MSAAPPLGNLIVDIFPTGPIADAAIASDELTRTAGVLEHGLFVPRSTTLLMVGNSDGTVTKLE